MTYSKKDWVTAICMMIFIITFAVTFTLFFTPLYDRAIYRLGIDITSGIDVETIKENYRILIQYQSIFYRGSLHMPDFIMSANGRIHFEEVKRIFECIQITMVASAILSVLCISQQIRQKEYRFLRLTSIITVVLPLIIGILAMVNFNQAFIIFHKIFFRNDYWIFDARTDPVIQILPQAFFMHSFIMIIILVIAICVLCYGIYRYQQKRIITQL
jgi:integral membrane protein (TIGR01906 family)